MTRSRWFQMMLSVLFVCCCGLLTPAQSVDRAQLEKEVDALWEQIKAKEAPLLATSAADQAAFAEFLQQPETGLIRLLPRERYETKLKIRGGGAYYSFTRLTHEYGYGSDLELQQGKFSVGFAGADSGFLIALGDTPLEEVTLDHPGVRFPAEFTPPTKEADARAQHRQTYTGIQVGDFTYKYSLPAAVNTSYVVRSIQYDTADVLVAFRVVRKDYDGSLILLWKMLKKFPVPKLERASEG